VDPAMHAAVTIGLHDNELPKEFGSFNDMPPNWEEITESEFIWLFNVKPANRKQYYRQVVLPTVKGHYSHSVVPDYKATCSVFFWVFPDFSGVGFITHYNGAATRSREDAYFAQWFKFKWCEHEWETLVSRMCYHEYRCTKCGYKEVVDSSD